MPSFGPRSAAFAAAAAVLLLASAQHAVDRRRACDLAVSGPCCLLSEAEASAAAGNLSRGIERRDFLWGQACVFHTEDERHAPIVVVFPAAGEAEHSVEWWTRLPGVNGEPPKGAFPEHGTSAKFVPAHPDTPPLAGITGWMVVDEPFPWAVGGRSIPGAGEWMTVRTASYYIRERIRTTVTGR